MPPTPEQAKLNNDLAEQANRIVQGSPRGEALARLRYFGEMLKECCRLQQERN